MEKTQCYYMRDQVRGQVASIMAADLQQPLPQRPANFQTLLSVALTLLFVLAVAASQ